MMSQDGADERRGADAEQRGGAAQHGGVRVPRQLRAGGGGVAVLRRGAAPAENEEEEEEAEEAQRVVDGGAARLQNGDAGAVAGGEEPAEQLQVVDGHRAAVHGDSGEEGVAGDEQGVLEAAQRRAQTARNIAMA